MTDIVIRNIDESFIKVHTSAGISSELSDRFMFKAPGFQYTPKYKKGIWDGFIRLYSATTGRTYRGLADEVIKYANKEGYTWSYEDMSITKIDRDAVEAYIKTLNLKIEPRYYQIDAVHHGLQMHRAVILSPTASGKSLIIYILARYMIDVLGLRGLMVVPNTGLVEQMYTDSIDYANGTWDVSGNVQKIYSGQEKSFVKPLTISTWQSIFRNKPDFFKQFDFVIVDETHHCKAKSLSTIMASLVNAKYRIGLTGTLDGKLANQLSIQGHFGSVKRVASTSELMEQKYLAAFKIKSLLLKYTPDECNLAKKLKYQDEVAFLVSHSRRNKFISRLAAATEKNTLVLFNYIAHGKELHRIITSIVPSDRKVFFVYGKTDVEIREEVRSIVEGSENAIVVASVGVYSTGTNIRNLHNIIFASPSKSRIRVLQSIGRALRLSDNKNTAILYDIADDLRHGKKLNTTLTHFDERIKVYNSEKFEFKVTKVDL